MISYVLIKLTSRCNYDCKYCYWFQDESVKSLPALISEEVIDAFLAALSRHIQRFHLKEFVCSFHGGEPTLFGCERLSKLIAKLDMVGDREKCNMRYAITTNASLIDDDWIRLILKTKMSVAVSLDGPPEVHDSRRVTIQQKSTWEQTVNGYLSLCRAGVKPAILAVCHPSADPSSVIDHIADDLGAVFCDILIPDADHTSPPPKSVAPFYIGLFDAWYEKYAGRGVEVRIIGDFIRGLLGLETRTDSIGYAPMQTVCLNTNGKLEPHDALRIAGASRVDTECNIISSEISDVYSDKLWSNVRVAATDLCDTCLNCIYKHACGGGHLAHRWSEELKYKNPSIYCDDLKKIFSHIAKCISIEFSNNTEAKGIKVLGTNQEK